MTNLAFVSKNFFLLISTIIFCNIYQARADKQDSIKSYNVGQIVKTAEENQPLKRISTTDIVKYRDIQKSDALSVAEIAPLTPSARIETNSRGETLLYLRNAGERQTALFFDGALLNIPWDNRMDLSFIPTDIIGSMTIAKGSSSVLYGPNTMGGAVSISTFERQSDGNTNILSAMGVEGDGYLLSGTSHNRSDETNIIVHFNTLDMPGILEPGISDYTLFNQDNSNFLTNTFQRRNTGYIRAETEFGGVKVGLGVLGINGTKGVMPQDNRLRRSRYWQYDNWERAIGILNLAYPLDNGEVRTTFWVDGFSQNIEQYSSIEYDALENVLSDNDRTFGTRLILDYQVLGGMLSSSVTSYYSRHYWDETDQNRLEFSQNTTSLASEYRNEVYDIDYVIGLNYDINTTPLTGLFVDNQGNCITDLGFIAGLGYNTSANSRLFANVSRKNRFPTMREQYSDADRFIINPNLSPEIGYLSELGWVKTFDNHTLGITAFYNIYEGLIEVQPVAGDSLGRDIRVNIDDAVIPGIELEASGKFENISSTYLANLSLMRPRGNTDGTETVLETRPEVIGFVRVENSSIDNLSIMPEFRFNGSQISFNDGVTESIGFQYMFNMRLAYKAVISSTVLEIFTRLDNITNENFLYKIGFPAPGRTIRLGLKTIL